MSYCCKSRIVVNEILVLGLITPVYGIDCVRLIVTILYTLLVTVEFLTVEDERYTLRCVDSSLSQLDHRKTLLFSSFCSLLETVAQTVVVVAAHITYMLKRIVCPCRNAYLRMLDTTCNSKFHIRLISCYTVHEAGIRAVERSTYSVTDIIAECAYLVKHICVDLQRDLIFRICWSRCSPTLTVDDHIRINGMETLADFIHCVDIMNSHKVETEAVNMIFLHPPFQRLDHIFAEHLPFRSGFISTAGTVEERSVLAHTVEITRHGPFETCGGSIGGMVVHNVKNNSEASIVQGLNHLLELLDSGYRIVWVSRE